MNKKQKIAEKKRFKTTLEEMISLNELQKQQLITQLSSINQDLEDLEALPRTKQMDNSFYLKLKAQAMGKQKAV